MSIFEKLGFTQTKQEPTIQVNMPEPPKEEVPEPGPLESQADWFKADEKDIKPVEFDPAKLFDADPAKLQEAIGNLNFLDGTVTPELLGKIQEGGEEATKITLQLMNKVAQQTMGAAIQASSKMIESSFAKSAPILQQKIGETNRNTRIEEAIKSASPAFQSPAAQFMVDTLKERFATKFPNATTAEWQSMAKSFIDDLAKVATPAAQEDKKDDPMATDWGKFLA